MKWLVAYTCRINGVLTFGNCVLPEAFPPMNWVAMANREARNDKDRHLVEREYTLVNYWQVSDFEASKWDDDGTGYLCLPAKERSEKP